MKTGNQPHILGASSSLMGICFVIVTGMKLVHADIATYADEISMAASFGFLCSCIFSYMSMRQEARSRLYERMADRFFIIGIVALFIAVMIFAIGTGTF